MKMHLKHVLLPMLVLALAACAVNPHKTAQTFEQEGDATYGELVIAKEQGAKILQDASVSDVVKRPIAQLIVKAKPVTDGLQDTIVLYDEVKAGIASGASTEEQLAIVNRDLAGWIAKAQPLITELVAAVSGARK
jgi:hypothetical protein